MTETNLENILSELKQLEVRCKDGTVTADDFAQIIKNYTKLFGTFTTEAKMVSLRYGMFDAITTAVDTGVITPSFGRYYEQIINGEFHAATKQIDSKQKVMEVYSAFYEAISLPVDQRFAHMQPHFSDSRTINKSINFLYDFFSFLSSDEFIRYLAQNLAVYYAHYVTTSSSDSFDDARNTIRALSALGKLSDEQETEFSAAVATKRDGILNEILDTIGIPANDRLTGRFV